MRVIGRRDQGDERFARGPVTRDCMTLRNRVPADLSLRLAHSSFCWFCRAAAQFIILSGSLLPKDYLFRTHLTSIAWNSCKIIELHHEKTCLMTNADNKVQINLRIRAV